MDSFRQLVSQSEPLLLFSVISIGFVMGQIKIRGFKLGVAGVLFAGLFFGGWQPAGSEPLVIVHQVMQIGLILFVYTVGLTSSAGFFAALKSHGLKFNIAILYSLGIGAFITIVVGMWMQLEVGQIAGVFCGGLTNTPALASVTELIRNTGIGDPRDPAVGYSVTYPFGIIGGMLAFELFFKIYNKAARKEKTESDSHNAVKLSLATANFEITNPEIIDRSIGELRVRDKIGLIISRHQHDGELKVPTKYARLLKNDIVTVVGQEADIEKATEFFGARSQARLETENETISMRRILVSDKKLAGKPIGELNLDQKFGAQITRVRRADVDFVPNDETTLQVGDRVRVVMPLEKFKTVSDFFGDSEKGISELDYTALTLGISLGVLIGMIPIPLPGGTFVSLGFAGGPLVAGLVLGRIGRSGKLVWQLPLESNKALCHIGLLFFLAAVGVMAGSRFFEALTTNGWQLFTLGLITTTVTTTLTLLLLRHYGKASIVSAIGATCGMQTQPATLAHAYEKSKSEETYVAYATTYPAAMIGKIMLAQLIPVLCNLFL